MEIIINQMIKQLNKYLPKTMINPYYFTDRSLQVGFTNTLDSHHDNHTNSKIKIKPNFTDFELEF